VDATNDRVGVGLTSPQTLLELNQGGGYGQVKHLTLSRNENTRYNAYAGFGDQFGANTFGWRFGTVNNSTDYPTLYIVNGNVGIGTSTTPTSPLTVSAVSGDGIPLLRLTSTSAPGAVNWISSSMNSSLAANASTVHLFGQAQSQYNSGYVGFRYAGASSSSNYLTFGLYASDYLLNILGNGNVGINTVAPSTKLHVVVATPGGAAGAPSGTSILVDSNTNNFVTVRSTADNATNSGILMQDNNVGGYLIFRNYDSSNAAISDRMFLSGYQGVNISYGTSDGTDVTSRTTVAKFDSGGATVNSLYITTPVYSASYTYSASWTSSLQTIVPVATIAANTTFLVDISTDSYGDTPYYSHTSFLYRTTAGTNTNGNSSEQSMLTSHHVPSSTYWAIAAKQGLGGQSNGLAARLVNGPGTSNTIYVRLYALTGRP
jgi:hypothetical protein